MTLVEQLGWMKRMEKRAEEIGWGATVREHLRALEGRWSGKRPFLTRPRPRGATDG